MGPTEINEITKPIIIANPYFRIAMPILDSKILDYRTGEAIFENNNPKPNILTFSVDKNIQPIIIFIAQTAGIYIASGIENRNFSTQTHYENCIASIEKDSKELRKLEKALKEGAPFSVPTLIRCLNL